MAVLKVRMTFLLASQQAGAFALSPIAGVISQFGLFWPWHHDQGLKLLEAFFLFFQAKLTFLPLLGLLN